MLLRLDPAIATVWRTPSALQFGVDPARLVIDPVTAHDERMIAALELGTTASALAAIGGAGRASALLDRLGGVLDAGRAAPSVAPEVRIRSGALDAIRAQLRLLLPARPAPVLDAGPALLVVDHAAMPAEHRSWLRADRPHLAVVFGERGAVVGPLVRPGVTACLRCRDLHRVDADPAWPAIATQLVRRPAPAAEDAVLRAEAIALGVGALARGAGPGAGTAVRLGVDGERAFEPLVPHPMCGCQGLPA